MTQTLFKGLRDPQYKLTFEVKILCILPIKLLDLVRMTSVLLNNAIEGAAKVIKKNDRCFFSRSGYRNDLSYSKFT